MPKEINKVIYGDNVLIDLTQDTVSPAKLIEGSTAHNARGEVTKRNQFSLRFVMMMILQINHLTILFLQYFINCLLLLVEMLNLE